MNINDIDKEEYDDASQICSDDELYEMFSDAKPLTQEDLDEIGRVNREIMSKWTFKLGCKWDNIVHYWYCFKDWFKKIF